ncbi:hypothetical protein [Dendronalium sp. ChiSLP03b]|uniref:hypothetical protein n=1 Tax=Dendronalium sp. ChiSLP03b TaxID=3075381 RepID=UPI002AD1D8B4|nr:hypothetical protein [Dendronalium sp. ChiSLP03b]MDZ8206939.1 hypothetical protein [Dendronalium sp. ChiSLP03b]
MNAELIKPIYEVEPQPGEKLNLPEPILESITTKRWVITIEQKAEEPESTRSYDGFLNAYIPEDEGLYDDYPNR